MNQVLIKVIGNYQYQATHCLGEGVYGKVYEGIQRESKEKVAIKKIDLLSLMNDKYLENAIFSQIYLLKRFDHPNIVKFRDVLSSKNSLYIITEFCKGGDLRDLIKKKRFTEQQAFDVIRQIAYGFSQLVAKKVVHRDLKPANILLHDGVYKIADFGFAKYVDNFGSQMLKSCVGSPIYMAPQLLQRQTYTTKCDVWSLGIITYEMLFGLSPWRAKDESELIHGLKTIPITSILKHQKHLSPKMYDFISNCLAYYEKDRYSWSDIFNIFIPEYIHQSSISSQYSSSNTSPSKTAVRIYNPKTRSTQPLEPLNSTTATTTKTQKQRIEDTPPSIIRRTEQQYRSPKLNYLNTQYNTPHEKYEKPQINHTYTPRQHHNHSINLPTPIYTPRQHPNITIPNLQFPSTPASVSAIPTSPRPLSNQTPRKSYIEKQNRQAGDYKKQQRLHNESLYRYFCCTELLLNYHQMEAILIDMYPYLRLLYVLIQMVKLQNSYVRSELLVAPYSKSTQQLLLKIQAEQRLTQVLEKDIMNLLGQKHCLQRCQDQIKSRLGLILTELMNEQKLSKFSQLLLQSLKQNAIIVLKQKRNRYSKQEQISDTLWAIGDLLTIHSNKTNSLIEVSQRDESERDNGMAIEFRIQRLILN